MVDDEELLELVELELRELLSFYKVRRSSSSRSTRLVGGLGSFQTLPAPCAVPGRRRAGGARLGAQGAGRQRRHDRQGGDPQADGRGGQLHPRAGAPAGPALPHVPRGRLQHPRWGRGRAAAPAAPTRRAAWMAERPRACFSRRSRHGGDGAHRAGADQAGRGCGDRGHSAHHQDHVHGRGDVQEVAAGGPRGRQRGHPPARHQARRRATRAAVTLPSSPTTLRRFGGVRALACLPARRPTARGAHGAGLGVVRCSSSSARRTSLGRSSCRRASRWSCRATTSPPTSS
eukprot:scaffold886_cov317-Prasinococcus_capsulatus_cf.AAC.16